MIGMLGSELIGSVNGKIGKRDGDWIGKLAKMLVESFFHFKTKQSRVARLSLQKMPV